MHTRYSGKAYIWLCCLCGFDYSESYFSYKLDFLDFLDFLIE